MCLVTVGVKGQVAGCRWSPWVPRPVIWVGAVWLGRQVAGSTGGASHEEHRVGRTPAALRRRLSNPGTVAAWHRRRCPKCSGNKMTYDLSGEFFSLSSSRSCSWWWWGLKSPSSLGEGTKTRALPGSLEAVAPTPVRLRHGIALTLGTDQPLSHQLSAPQFELTRGAGLFHLQVHTVTASAERTSFYLHHAKTFITVSQSTCTRLITTRL